MMATFAQTNSTSDFEVQIQVVAVQNCSYSCMKIAQILQIYPPKVVKIDEFTLETISSSKYGYLRVCLPIVASRRYTFLEKVPMGVCKSWGGAMEMAL